MKFDFARFHQKPYIKMIDPRVCEYNIMFRTLKF